MAWGRRGGGLQVVGATGAGGQCGAGRGLHEVQCKLRVRIPAEILNWNWDVQRSEIFSC